MQRCFDTLYRMDELEKVDQADKQYRASKAAADRDKEALFETWVNAARAGHTADHIAARSAFTAAHIRRILRDRGIEPLPPGPKRKTRRLKEEK
jgi:hypothetical protein